MKEIFNREIKSTFSHRFEVTEEGLYQLSIKASCQPGWRNSWWIRFKGFIEDKFDVHFDDDDLRVEIDDLSFGKPRGVKGFFNSPAAFSGTKTLGKTKTIVFILKLSQGAHILEFIPDGAPYLEGLTLEKADRSLIKLDLDDTASNENYYSWYTLVFVEQPLSRLSLTARSGVSPPQTDDDDVKIVIDGEVQKKAGNRHPDSYFCGFTIRGKENTFTKELNFPKGTHFVELFADKTPTLLSIELGLNSLTRIKTYRPGSKGEDYNRFDGDILDSVNFWNEFFLSQPYPPPEPLDPDLVKAVIYVESRMGYGISTTGHPSYPDVMQVANPDDDAIHVLADDGKRPVEYEAASGKVKSLDYGIDVKIEKPGESIYWGVRWVYHKAQGISKESRAVWFSWKQAVRRFGPGRDAYTESVWNLYKEGLEPSGKRIVFSELLIILSVLASVLLISKVLAASDFNGYREKGGGETRVVSKDRAPKSYLDLEFREELSQQVNRALSLYPSQGWDESIDVLREVGLKCRNGPCDPEFFFNDFLDLFANTFADAKEFSYAVSLLHLISTANSKMADLDDDGQNEVVVLQRDPLSVSYVDLKVIDYNKGERITGYRLRSPYFSSANSNRGPADPLAIYDVTGDALPEVILFLSSGREGAKLYVFRYNGKNLKPIFEKTNLLYPEYTFADADGDKVLDVLVTGYRSDGQGKVKEKFSLRNL